MMIFPMNNQRAVIAGALGVTLIAGIYLGAFWLPLRLATVPVQTPTGEPVPEQAQAVGLPKLAIAQIEYDFGTMETNGASRHEFLLENQGDGPLILASGRSSCGCCTCLCETILPEQGKIPAGESAKVALQWKINQYTGDFQQSECLATNDPQRPELTLRVTGRITPTVRIVPTQLVFTRVEPGRPAVGEIQLFAYRRQPLEILGWELSDPSQADSFQLTVQGLPADQLAAEPNALSGCVLRIEIRPELAGRPFRQQIVVKTNVPSAAAIEVPVEGTVGSDLAVAGFGWDDQTGVLTLGTIAVSKGTERKFQVVVNRRGTGQVTLRPIRVIPDLLQVEVGQARLLGKGPAELIPCTLRIPPGSKPANHLGSKASDLGLIVLETGYPPQPELRLLVRFAVRPDPER
jgi:hypothetical protein